MKKNRSGVSTAIRLALVMAVICGLAFPAAVTAIGQGVFPYQANGEIAKLNNSSVGSYLIGQQSVAPYLFHIRNDSASGVDPDITVASAMSQAVSIHNYTGIPLSFLDSLINNYTRHTLFFSGTGYVNVLNLNLELINTFHASIPEYAKIYREVGNQ